METSIYPHIYFPYSPSKDISPGATFHEVDQSLRMRQLALEEDAGGEMSGRWMDGWIV